MRNHSLDGCLSHNFTPTYKWHIRVCISLSLSLSSAYMCQLPSVAFCSTLPPQLERTGSWRPLSKGVGSRSREWHCSPTQPASQVHLPVDALHAPLSWQSEFVTQWNGGVEVLDVGAARAITHNSAAGRRSSAGFIRMKQTEVYSAKRWYPPCWLSTRDSVIGGPSPPWPLMLFLQV